MAGGVAVEAGGRAAAAGGSGAAGGESAREAAGPKWKRIRRHAAPEVLLPQEYGTPYPLPQATAGWEDGLFVSRDGLRVYAFYSPADLIQYATFVAQNPGCPEIGPFLRGPRLGMDLHTNPWGCERVLHSDIVVASRADAGEEFGRWRRTGIANPYVWDGAYQELPNDDGTFDVVVSVSTEKRQNDLYWARGVGPDPSFEQFEPLPRRINSKGQEDNPHLERLDARTLVLLFDNDGVEDPTTTIKYSISKNDGRSWSRPRPLGPSVNAGPHDLTAHLYHDGEDWWLYFASARDGALAIFRSRHNRSAKIRRRFDDWGPTEKVIAPGTVGKQLGVMAAVGEPTLTAEGDIAFVVVYRATKGATEFDAFDADPWYLPRKR